MIVFDTSTIVGAAIRRDSVPGRALSYACEEAGFALSDPVYKEIVEVLHRPRLARFIDAVLRDEVLDLLTASSTWFDPVIRVTDCRDSKDNIYLELALAACANMIVSSDSDLLVLHPWRATKILAPSDYIKLIFN